MTDAFDHRRGLTFGQAEGVTPLPTQLAAGTVSQELSARVWSVLHASISSEIITSGYSRHWRYDSIWEEWLHHWWVYEQFGAADEIPSATDLLNVVKSIVYSNRYIQLFDFIQSIAQKAGPEGNPTKGLRKALEDSRSAYRLVGDLVLPVSSSEQADAVGVALEIARAATAQGPHSHLRRAASALSNGQWSVVIQESIHAVEGAAKAIEPSADTLGPALTKLQETAGLPPALKKAFGALYGWTSDEKGIRHALVFDGQPAVTERDALFMFGACASFVGYLLA